MLLDSTILISDVIGDVEGVDIVGRGGNVGVAVFKDAPDNDNDADDDGNDQKDDDDGWDRDEAVATDFGVAVIDDEGNGRDGTGVDCASVPVGGLKYD